ncbi:5-methyltetrahydropteroyltriglutamate--homocysteine methyltransferase [Haloferula luteola]|uniref:5-methyltetrahydropteroyltriglutamate--homocysteine methyltransferase n=1 Tax=Haloferula luteola TaxID=595692 RepID=A0A840VAZ8_9BACT|nr:5-methyltetrahydropteroyltriglutamate--homocysteine S-methyltransferase [Haloferula luteola]MBB5352724.1 5-methyltetrahydropteroyltriglutamate--homocysteine methyltransferase [Haloferula luteola]
MNLTTHVSGYPRIGEDRELKKALEAFWRGQHGAAELDRVATELRHRHWQEQAELDFVAVNDFSLYDSMLDLACVLGVVPERFGPSGVPLTLERYFRMARGRSRVGGAPDVPALEMTKWFDTNYHYLVPELEKDTEFQRGWDKPIRETREAIAAGFRAKPVMVGPLTFLALSKRRDGGDPLEALGRLLPVYRELLRDLRRAGAEWVEVSEPILAERQDGVLLGALKTCWSEALTDGPKILLAVPFGGLGPARSILATSAVDGVHVDVTRAGAEVDALRKEWPRHKVLSLGVIDGRQIWRADLDALRNRVAGFRDRGNHLWIGSSCSLLHVPHSVDREKTLDPELRSWMAFAREKVAEIGAVAAAERPVDACTAAAEAARRRRQHAGVEDSGLRTELANLSAESFSRSEPVERRRALQSEALGLPLFPTTTIGSFPQTDDIRTLRSRYRRGLFGDAAYEAGLDVATAEAIRIQEDLGLDVLVHGEFERTDMVEFFGELLEGMVVTAQGWVQSYGSRCVKPPVIWGDIFRSQAMTVDRLRRAQAKTSKPLKGMLTGPVTILQWSFVRDDLSRSQVALQLAWAIRAEVVDLERAGLKIIQVDEPGLREGLPLAPKERRAYLDGAVRAFRLATSGVAGTTQIHTHMCYAEFEDVAAEIAALDADVITLEAARSGSSGWGGLVEAGLGSAVGPGVWDIHSPRVPSVEEMAEALRQGLKVLPAERLWVNPDCGLKTRGWEETRAALAHLVEAAERVAAEVKERELLTTG